MNEYYSLSVTDLDLTSLWNGKDKSMDVFAFGWYNYRWHGRIIVTVIVVQRGSDFTLHPGLVEFEEVYSWGLNLNYLRMFYILYNQYFIALFSLGGFGSVGLALHWIGLDWIGGGEVGRRRKYAIWWFSLCNRWRNIQDGMVQ